MSIIQNFSDEMKSHPNCLHFASWGTGRRNIQNNLNKNKNKEPFFHLQNGQWSVIIICLSRTHFTTDVVKTLLMIWSKGTGYCSNMFKCSSTSNMIIWTKHEYCKAHMCPYDRNSHKVHVATQPQPSWAGKRNIFDALHFCFTFLHLHFAILLEKMVLVVSRKWSLWQFEPILFRGERALNNWSKDILCCDMLKNKALISKTKHRPTIWKHYIEESVLLTGLKNKR